MAKRRQTQTNFRFFHC